MFDFTAATKSHTEVQGEILEGLVVRIVSTSSVKRLKEVLKDFPLLEVKGMMFKMSMVINHINEMNNQSFVLSGLKFYP